LQNELKENDPLFFEKGEMKNPQRMMRALEIIKTTGISILNHHTGEKKKRNFSIIKIGLELPREELTQRINSRVDEMMRQGLVEEVTSLYTYKHLNALQTVGYTEMFEYLDNRISLARAIELIKTHTRQYAKRQMTWFKRDKEIHWFTHASGGQVISFLERE
jgi:tRNA dimethylallyltransferase